MKKDIRKYGVPLLYGALFIYMVWVMADRMPLYGYLRVGLAVLFFFDYFVWRLFRHSPAMQGRAWVRKGLTLFYFLPFVLLVVFCAALSFRDLQDWAPFWRTYLAGSVFVLLSTHFCYGAVWAFFQLWRGSVRGAWLDAGRTGFLAAWDVRENRMEGGLRRFQSVLTGRGRMENSHTRLPDTPPFCYFCLLFML